MRAHEMELLPSAKKEENENVMRFDQHMTSLSHAFLCAHFDMFFFAHIMPTEFPLLSHVSIVVAAGAAVDHRLRLSFSLSLRFMIFCCEQIKKKNVLHNILRASSCTACGLTA